MTSQTAPSTAIPTIITDDGSSGGNDAPLNRSDPDRWYFPKERLDTTPSRKSGIDADKELTYRQQSANFIQDIGQRLQVNQLCINTAIVYMHRFYMFHSFAQFHRNAISAASIFLAAKVEEQPRKLEHVIKVAHYCLHRDHQPQMDSKSEQYLEQSAELVMNENILLQTLGFDVAIDHPHTHVVKCCQLVRASKDLAQTSYFMATNSLHLTSMCLQYKPTVVACVCIHLACKWSSWEIPRSKEGKDWFWYVDDTVTTELLEKLTTDFLQIFNKSPSRLKKKINSLNNAASTLSLTSGPYHGFDSSPSQHHQSRSRSPSPKRQVTQKSSSSQQPGVPGKPRPHLLPHHPMKIPYPPGASASSSSSNNNNANKHSSSSHGSSSHPSHPHPSSHSSSGKPPHPGMPPGNMKDPHHSHHSQHPKNPYPPHSHGQHNNMPHGQYPHGGGRPNMQSSSSSSQSHHGHGMHSKPPTMSGSTSSSSHPYSSSTSIKNMQTHNPSNKPPHNMPPSSGAPKLPPNQMPGAAKNPNQSMFHSSTSQSHLKKPYLNEQGRPEFGIKRDGVNPGSVHHSKLPHDKMMSKDGRHHSSAPGMPQSHNTGDSRGSSHHNMPYLNQDLDRSSGSSNPKNPYMDSRSMDASLGETNRHRNIPDAKRNMPHGSSAATNGNNNDSISSLGAGGGGGSGAGDSHVPSKRPPSSTGNTFGHNSSQQQDMGAGKYHADGFGGEYGSYGSSSTILSIEDRRKRRHAEAMSMGSSGSGNNSSSNSKRPRSDNYSALSQQQSIPSLHTNSLFSPEELSDSVKRLPPPTSQFSPSAAEGTQSYNNSKVNDNRSGSNAYGGSTSEGIVFGSSSADIKPDLRRVNPSVEFQPPDLLQPINDIAVKSETMPSLSVANSNNNAPRAASLFSPEFTPTNSAPSTLSISPSLMTTIESHKRDALLLNPKHENADQQSSSGYSEGGSQISFTGRLSNSPKREDGKDAEDSHSSKKAKKKKEKHKHKHKEDKKHKKDKHKDREKEKEKDKEKKDKHRSKDKHSSSIPTPEVSNDVSSHKIKIKLNRDDGSKGSSMQSSTTSSSSRHSSSKTNNSSSSNSITPAPLTSLKVKISNKERVSSIDEDFKFDSSSIKIPSLDDESTPCCPGFGPCLVCNKETSQDQYRFFSSMPVQGLTMKIGKNKETSKSSKESSSASRDSKKSKDKNSKSGGSSSSSSSSASALHGNSLPPALSLLSSSSSMANNARSSFATGSHHLHKNGMEKSSKKKEKSVV